MTSHNKLLLEILTTKECQCIHIRPMQFTLEFLNFCGLFVKSVTQMAYSITYLKYILSLSIIYNILISFIEI